MVGSAERRGAELGYSIQPYCVIVGGGQAGIGLGARLKQLQVPTLILEKTGRAGDSWRNRYKSLGLHDPVWADHLPYLQFPETWPVFSRKDKMGDWLETYTKVMELNYWSSTECLSVRFEEDKKEWSVLVCREGTELELRPKQLVLATGVSGMPNVPDIPNAERFKGEIYHSSAYSCAEDYRGKRVVVVGSNSSAHDIAADLWENGADVTMIKRSSTHVCRTDSLLHYHLATVYSESAVESGITIDLADMTLASIPYRIMPEFQLPITDKIRAQEEVSFYSHNPIVFPFPRQETVKTKGAAAECKSAMFVILRTLSVRNLDLDECLLHHFLETFKSLQGYFVKICSKAILPRYVSTKLHHQGGS